MAPPRPSPLTRVQSGGEGEERGGEGDNAPNSPPSHRLSKYGTGAYNPHTIFTRCLKSEAFAKSTIFVRGKLNFRSINET